MSQDSKVGTIVSGKERA